MYLARASRDHRDDAHLGPTDSVTSLLVGSRSTSWCCPDPDQRQGQVELSEDAAWLGDRSVKIQ
jgi:hypothetical protein